MKQRFSGSFDREQLWSRPPSSLLSMWMAGGGIKGGVSFGETDPFGYNVQFDGVHVRDFHATLLHLMGIDHERLSVKFQGLDARMTGVEPPRIGQEVLV